MIPKQCPQSCLHLALCPVTKSRQQVQELQGKGSEGLEARTWAKRPISEPSAYTISTSTQALAIQTVLNKRYTAVLDNTPHSSFIFQAPSISRCTCVD